MLDNKYWKGKKIVSVKIPEITQKKILADIDTKEFVWKTIEAILSLEAIFGNNKK